MTKTSTVPWQLDQATAPDDQRYVLKATDLNIGQAVGKGAFGKWVDKNKQQKNNAAKQKKIKKSLRNITLICKQKKVQA